MRSICGPTEAWVDPWVDRFTRLRKRAPKGRHPGDPAKRGRPAELWGGGRRGESGGRGGTPPTGGGIKGGEERTPFPRGVGPRVAPGSYPVLRGDPRAAGASRVLAATGGESPRGQDSPSPLPLGLPSPRD